MNGFLAAVILACNCLGIAPARFESIPAFPGAEGFGMFATGGRAGKVIEVTNLDDSGPGSLREAVRGNEPRIIIFRVSGTIELKKTLSIGSNLTIAGQTAPGDGICLANYGTSLGGAENVIIRFLRFRPGDKAGVELDSLGGTGCRRVIVDHCSASWSVDECVSFYDNNYVTIQWCIISESLYHSVHSKGNHGYGGIWGGPNSSFHHNLLAHHSSRNPRISDSGSTRPLNNVDLRNNVIYNWGFNSLYGGKYSAVNLINCYYKPGPGTSIGVRSRLLDGQSEGGRWYISGNFLYNNPLVTADNWLGVHRPWADKQTMIADEPFEAAYVRTHDANEAYQMVLVCAGAILPKRDPIDTRIVEEVYGGSATYGGVWGDRKGIIDTQQTVGGWPQLKSVQPPEDLDHDGMPDLWEQRFGLDPSDPSDGPKDKDKDGYTNLEEYLNGTDPCQFVDYIDPNNNVDPFTIAAWEAKLRSYGNMPIALPR